MNFHSPCPLIDVCVRNIFIRHIMYMWMGRMSVLIIFPTGWWKIIIIIFPLLPYTLPKQTQIFSVICQTYLIFCEIYLLFLLLLEIKEKSIIFMYKCDWCEALIQ